MTPLIISLVTRSSRLASCAGRVPVALVSGGAAPAGWRTRVARSLNARDERWPLDLPPALERLWILTGLSCRRST